MRLRQRFAILLQMALAVSGATAMAACSTVPSEEAACISLIPTWEEQNCGCEVACASSGLQVEILHGGECTVHSGSLTAFFENAEPVNFNLSNGAATTYSRFYIPWPDGFVGEDVRVLYLAAGEGGAEALVETFVEGDPELLTTLELAAPCKLRWP